MANYSQLIQNAITDFNRVWTALNDKGDLVKNWLNDNETTLVPTSAYGSLVSNLVFIEGLSANTATLYASGSQTALKTGTTVSKSGQTFNLVGEINSAGYYAAGAKVTTTLTATAIDLAAARGANNFVLGTDGYSLVASNYVIGSITAAAATNTNTQSLIIGTFDDKGTATQGAVSTSLGLELEAKASGSTTNILVDNSSTFKIKVKATAGTSGTVSAKTTNVVTEGYITADDAADMEISTLAITDSAEDDIVIGIQAGSITVSSKEGTTASATLSDGAAGIIQDSARSGKDDYAIATSVSGVELDATVTEGYVTTGTTVSVGAINTSAGTKYIKHGDSKDQTITVSDHIEVTAGSEYLATTGKTVTLTIDSTKATATADIEEGYIKTNEAGTITVAGTASVKIAEATAFAKYNISDYTKGGTLPTVASGGYTLTVTPVVDVDKTGTTFGWIDGADDITTGAAATNVSSVTYHVAEATITPSAVSFSATLTERDGDGSGKGTINTTTDLGSLFLDSAPATGDYFTVESGFGYTVSAGYTAGGSASPSVTKYMKKAVITHRETGVDGEDYFEVTEGGYLPSGVLKDISTFAPAAASVSATLTGSPLVTSFATGKTASDYIQLSLTKGTVNAGYISKTQGTLALDANYYIAKGSAAAKPTISAVQAAGMTRDTTSGVVYKGVLNATALSNLTVEAGYITASEVADAEAQVKTEEALGFSIPRAVFGSTSHTTNASIAASTNITGLAADETAKYTVAPRIDSCSTVFTVGTAGYISSADTDILRFDGDAVSHNGTMTSFGIHAGTGIASKTVSSDSVTVTDNFATNQTGLYTVTVGGNVTSNITLDQGYYGQSEASINAATFAVSKTLEVAHGNVTIGATGTNAFNANSNVTLLDTVADAEKSKYFAISATANFQASKTSVTQGYIKDNTTDVVLSGNSSTATVYIEKYEATTRSSTEAEQTRFDAAITIGQASAALPSEKPAKEETIVLATANKYSQKDTVVTLTPDAMGTNVIDQFLALERRLSGASASFIS